MNTAPSIAADIASATLLLSKQAWKLGISLSKLEQNAELVGTTAKVLIEDVKALGFESDLLYAELEEALSKSETDPRLIYRVNDRVWSCLEQQVEEIGRTIRELGDFIKSIRGQGFHPTNYNQRKRKQDEMEEEIAHFRIGVCRHTDNLQAILLTINTMLVQYVPGQELDARLSKLQDVLEKLQRHREADPQSQTSHPDADLMRCVSEAIERTTPKLGSELFAGGDGSGMHISMCVAEWVSILQAMRHEARDVIASDDHEEVDSDDDLDVDLAKAALNTGTTAFDAHEWVEADSLFQETLRGLQQLSEQQRAFCDIFGLHYKLAVCSYYVQQPPDAEEALLSLIKLPACSDDQHECILYATHLLSQLYIRLGQIDRARSECEKALQGRRRLLGKRSNASLESTALMAHIYVLLDNRARAKSCLAMIPEALRDTVIKSVEDSLGNEVEHLDFSSLLACSPSEGSGLAIQRLQSRLSGSTLGRSVEDQSYYRMSEILKTPAPSLRQLHRHTPSNVESSENLRPVTVKSLSSEIEASESRHDKEELSNGAFTADVVSLLGAVSPSMADVTEADAVPKDNVLSRKEILHRIGCQPKDQIEQAVCDGNHSALAKLLHKKKDFWRSKLRKRVRPERLTALHFAALFGEIDMAQHLLGSSFNINEVPYGYTTALPPLKVAIGARQVEMVEFLTANGARPSEPDSWSTLAGQLMSRSWLMKTMSEADREVVPSRIVAIMRILLKHGWRINEPYDSSGGTVLHQAVTFWTGSYGWDLALRTTITSFLCENGADPFLANEEGKTPYAMTLASDHMDLLAVLNRDSKVEARSRLEEPIELCG